MPKIYKTLVVAFVVVCIAWSYPHAQAFSSIEEGILYFNTRHVVNDNGTVEVTEEVTYDFGPNARHGIYRDIPFVKTNAQGEKYKLTFKNIQVYGDQFTLGTYNTSTRIKIGNPNKTITGKKTYKISYTVYGALTYFTDHDELYWNLTGNHWQVPIGAYRGEILLPAGMDAAQVKTACYTGIAGSTGQDCEFSINTEPNGTTKIAVVKNSLSPIGEGVTAVVSFPKGYAAVLEPKKYTDPLAIFPFVIGVLVLAALAIHVFILVRWWNDRSNTLKKQRIVSAWFEPPSFKDNSKFTPAETTLLLNKYLAPKTLTATLVSLAQRGYLKIVLGENGLGPFKRKAVSFISKKQWDSDPDLRVYERALLNEIFKDRTSREVTEAELKKSTTFSTVVYKLGEQVADKLFLEGLFKENIVKYQRTLSVALIFATAFGIVVPVIGLVLVILSWILKVKTSRRTDIGIEKYSEARSLYNFLISQTEQLNFQSHNQMFFEKLLPYATAFGVEKVWAERFKDLQFTNSDWIEGSNNLNSIAFISSINTINNRVYSMSSTTSSSGFSSGFSGGSSGGGGGGGGGGSW